MFRGSVVAVASVMLTVLTGCSHNSTRVIPSSEGSIASRQHIPVPVPAPAPVEVAEPDVPVISEVSPHAEPIHQAKGNTVTQVNQVAQSRGRPAVAGVLFKSRAPVVVVEEDLTAADVYRLDSADKVRISVFEQRNLSRVYTIGNGGYIDMPLIGAVFARGETTFSLSEKIARKLGAKYIKNPKVTTEIQGYRPFFILGEVSSSGQYAFVNNMTVRTAVAIAGGYTERANRRKILLTRRLNGKRYTTYVSAVSKVLPGDTIEVRERLF